jgi:Flp pilus assembly pilin Flp
MLRNFLVNETGAEMSEYAVAVALLVAIALIVYQVLGQGISDTNSDTAAAMQNPDPGVVP